MFFYYMVTHKCNLTCQHCIRGSKRCVDMDFDAAKNGLEKILTFDKNATLVITGGEPTLYPHFINLAEYAIERFREVIVTSNGTTDIFKKNIDALKSLHSKGLRLQFSLDGDEKAHDAMRGTGSWNKAMSNMDALSAKDIALWVSTVVTHDNMVSIERLRNELIRRKVQKWHVSQVLPFGCGKGLSAPTRAEWNALVDRLLDTVPMKLGIKKFFDFSGLEKLANEDIARMVGMAKKRKLMNCGSGTRKLYIYPDFSVSGCTCIHQLIFGYLNAQNLGDILSSPNAKAVRYYNLLEDSPCRKCRFMALCNGGCIGMSFHSTGQLGMGDCRCPYWQEISKDMRLVS